MRRDPAELRRALMRVAASLAGHFTAAQALAVGYSYPAQSYHVQRGDWTRIERGIYRFTDWPTDRNADLIRWALWSRGLGVVSHESALAIHELGDVMPAHTHLTVPTSFRGRSPGAILHRANLPVGDVEDHSGFRVTTPLRSLLDAAAAGMEADRLAHALRDALDRGVVREHLLRQEAERIPGAATRIGPALAQATM
jgi:predicted transcriptional regulator of viral defense system